MTVTNDTVIIQLEIPTDYLFPNVSLKRCEGGRVHASNDPHMTDIDGGVSAAPSEVDVITLYRLVSLFVNCNRGRGETTNRCICRSNCAGKPAKLSNDSAEIEQQFRAN